MGNGQKQGTVQLTIDNPEIELETENQPGQSSPCPVGTRVWLDIPAAGNQPSVVEWKNFQEFEVIADPKQSRKARLKPTAAGASMGTMAGQLRRYKRRWCIYQRPGDPQVSPPPDAYREAANFGYPLPAKVTSGLPLKIILPNWQRIFIRSFNLSGYNLPGEGNYANGQSLPVDPAQNQDKNADFTAMLQNSDHFYRKLHIRAIREPQTLAETPPVIYYGRYPDPNNPPAGQIKGLYAYQGNDQYNGTNPFDLPVNDPPWCPSHDPAKTLLIFYIKRFGANTGLALGQCHIKFRHLNNTNDWLIHKTAPNQQDYLSNYSVILISAEQFGLSHVAHEAGHSLLHDPGYDFTDPVFQQNSLYPSWKMAVNNEMEGLYTYDPALNNPAINRSSKYFDDLGTYKNQAHFQPMQYPSHNHLMNPTGGSIDYIYPVEVSIMRNSEQVNTP